MTRRKLIAWFGLFVASPGLAVEPQARYWVIPKEAIARLELRPLERTKQSGPGIFQYPGEDGQQYSQDDVMRGLLTYLFRK